MSRLLKKYSLKYQYLQLELEDTQEEYDLQEVEWKEIFGKYFNNIKTEMWVNQETGEMRDKPPGEEEKKKSKEKASKVKKLYRSASKIAHPDRGGSEEEFNNLKNCYESNDLLGLISYASEKDIPFEVEEEDRELLELSCKSVQGNIRKLRTSLIWNFFNGDTQMKTRVIAQLELEHKIKIDSAEILKELSNR